MVCALPIHESYPTIEHVFDIIDLLDELQMQPFVNRCGCNDQPNATPSITVLLGK
jgi:hypothetical protein